LNQSLCYGALQIVMTLLLLLFYYYVYAVSLMSTSLK